MQGYITENFREPVTGGAVTDFTHMPKQEQSKGLKI